MNSYSMQEYSEVGCMQLEKVALLLGHALWSVTGGRMCDTGCPAYKDGQAACFKKLTANEQSDPVPVRIGTKLDMAVQDETVRQEAKRRGVSIKQVRRERRDAINQKELDNV